MTLPSVAQLAALRREGQPADALDCGRRLLALQPADIDVVHLTGVLHCELDDCARGSQVLERLTHLSPSNEQAWLNLARANRRLGRHRLAYEFTRHSLALAPSDPAAAQLAATCAMNEDLSSLGPGLIRAACTRARQVEPLSVEAALLEGRCVKRTGALQLALQCQLAATALSPADFAALVSSAETSAALANPLQACTLYGWAWLLQPESHDVPYWLSQIQLRQGDFNAGWRNYEHRWLSSIGIEQAREAAPIRQSRPGFDRSVRGRRVLVWAEQGLGDEIMFGRLLGEFRPRCDAVVAQLDPRLLGLFSRAFPEIEFVGFDAPLPLERYDEQMPLGSLGGLLRPTRESFKGKGGSYLAPTENLAGSLRTDLRLAADERLIGVSWLSANPDSGASRSLALEALMEALQQDGVRLLNLQYGRVQTQIEAACERSGVELLQHPAIDITRDLEGLAGLVACCDLVVSVGNTTAHLAGALGQRSWVLLPKVAGWRWMEEGERCPWYDSLRLFRQTRRGEWAGVLSAIRETLRIELPQWTRRSY